MRKLYRTAANLFKGQGNPEMASTETSKPVEMIERYRAAMVLAGTGDALGYKGGEWEFCHQGRIIHEELKKMGGLDKIKVNKKNWCVSDDTVMHRATAEALVAHSRDESKPKLYSLMAEYYKECMKDMSGRAPGATCMSMTHRLNPKLENGYQIPFNPRGGGCGAAMRAMCIGLRYPRPEDIDDLIEVSIESGRMTHHHPTGYLGSLAAALFTAYSIQGKEPVKWAEGLLDVLNKAREYVKTGPHSHENIGEWSYFESYWYGYIEERKLKSGKVEFPANYDDPDVRDKFYKKISFGGWGGASGHDSTIIAYDAILGSNGDWEELCKRGVFHGGDSDSTGTIAACCYGAMYGFRGVPENNYKNLEYRKELEGIGSELYELAHPPERKTEEVEKTDEEPEKPGEIEAQPRDEDLKVDESQKEAMNTQPSDDKNKSDGEKPEEEEMDTQPSADKNKSDGEKPEEEEMDTQPSADKNNSDGEKPGDPNQSKDVKSASDSGPCGNGQYSDQKEAGKDPVPETGDPNCTKDIKKDNLDETTNSVSSSEGDMDGKPDKEQTEREMKTVGSQETSV